MGKTVGDPYGKDAFKYGTADNAAMRRMQERDRAFAPKPRKPDIVGPSPSPVNYGGTNVGVSSGRGGGLLAGLAKLFVIGVIILALGGYFGSHQSGQARRPSPSETAPRASYPAQPSYTSPPSYAMPQGEPPGNAGANATDPQKGSDISTAAPAPPPVPAQTNQTPAPSTSTMPQDDPIGPGGFITPHETEMVRKEVQVCVPINLLEHQWDSPPPGEKMEAFKSTARETIRDKARSIHIDDNTQFRVNDLFDGFDPARTDPRFLVTVLHPASGAATCPVDSHRYTLTVETNP